MADVKTLLDELKEESESGETHRDHDWRHYGEEIRAAVGARGTVLVVAAVGVGLWFLRPAPHAIPKTVPLTSYPGRQIRPAFSPDGKQVAFAWNGEKEDNFDIYVKLVDAGAPLRLTSNPADECAPAWSPDARYIAFCRDLPGPH